MLRPFRPSPRTLFGVIRRKQVKYSMDSLFVCAFVIILRDTVCIVLVVNMYCRTVYGLCTWYITWRNVSQRASMSLSYNINSLEGGEKFSTFIYEYNLKMLRNSWLLLWRMRTTGIERFAQSEVRLLSGSFSRVSNTFFYVFHSEVL
jgi:hypothetical protein